MLRASSRALVCDRLQSGRRATGITKQRRPPFPSNPASRGGKGGMCGSWIAVRSPAALAPRLVPGCGWQLHRAHHNCQLPGCQGTGCIMLQVHAISNPVAASSMQRPHVGPCSPDLLRISHATGHHQLTHIRADGLSSQGTSAASPLPLALSPTPLSHCGPMGPVSLPLLLPLSLSLSLSLSLTPSLSTQQTS